LLAVGAGYHRLLVRLAEGNRVALTPATLVKDQGMN
jgi:hypothetical protein